MTTFITNKINAKASKAGKTYWEIETNMGKATCFEYPVVQVLEANIGKPISLYDLEENDKGFINIRPHKSNNPNSPAPKQTALAPQPATAQPQAQQPTAENFAEARKAKDVSIYTSYAKDIFIELLKRKPADKEVEAQLLMDASIKLVKQAKISFERSEIFAEASTSSPKVIQTIQG